MMLKWNLIIFLKKPFDLRLDLTEWFMDLIKIYSMCLNIYRYEEVS
jgi:hypothetical protein